MEKKKLMIGEEIEMTEDFQIERIISKEIVNVKTGDKAIVRADGSVRYITGEARRMIQMLDDTHVLQGYHHENIAKMIVKRLNNYFGLGEMIEDAGFEISDSEFIDEIEDVLSEIL